MYELSEERRTFRHGVIESFKSLGKGFYGVLTHEFIAVAGQQFLLIDLDGSEGGISNRSRVVVDHFELQLADGELRAINLRTNQDHGKFVPGKPDFYYPPKGDWCEPYLYASGPLGEGSRGYKILIPLNGRPLEHARYRKQAEFGRQVLCGTHLISLRNSDAQMDLYADQRESLRQQVKSVASSGMNLEELVTKHEPLISLLKRHDWSFHYSDMHIPHSWDMEHKILAEISKLPTDEALAVWCCFDHGQFDYYNWSTVFGGY